MFLFPIERMRIPNTRVCKTHTGHTGISRSERRHFKSITMEERKKVSEQVSAPTFPGIGKSKTLNYRTKTQDIENFMQLKSKKWV